MSIMKKTLWKYTKSLKYKVHGWEFSFLKLSMRKLSGYTGTVQIQTPSPL